MTVATFLQTNNTTQDSNTYKNAIDGNFSVLAQIGDMFAPHQTSTPAMSITADPGALLVGNSVVAQAAQTAAVTANSSGNPRLDLAVLNIWTGVLSVIAGTPASSPVLPACPLNAMPLAQIAVANGAASIVNANITDLRATAPGVAAGLSMVGEVYGYQSGTSITLSGLTGTAGDRMLISAYGQYQPSSSGYAQLNIQSGSGGAKISLAAPTGQPEVIQAFSVVSGDTWGATIMTMGCWIASGTDSLIFQIAGVAGINAGVTLYAAYLKKQ